MSHRLFRTALVLGLLSLAGPLSIDMYLPALPQIAGDLGATVAATQLTLTAFFLAFGGAQLFWGPWSDQAGRRRPIFVGLAVFVAGAGVCALAPSVGWLTAGRFLQGIGGAVVMVVPRAVIRDLHTGAEATRLMALIMLVIAISPMLAPLAGSVLILLADWRVIFVVLALLGVFGIALTGTALPETLPANRRVPINMATMRAGLGTLLTSRKFLGLTFVGGFGMASFFVFIASASFVYTGTFGLSPMQFSLAFAFNAVGFFTASQLAAPAGARLGPARTVRLAVFGFVAATWLLLAVQITGPASLFEIIGFLFLGNFALGFVIPTTLVLALDDHGDIAGLASSLGGTLQMLAGGVMIALVGPFFNGTATPMVAAIAACAALSLASLLLVLPRAPVPQPGR